MQTSNCEPIVPENITSVKVPSTSRTAQVGILAVGNIATVGVSILMAAILSRLLDKSTYGTFRQILYIYATLAIVFQAGLPKAVSYFLPALPAPQAKAALVRILSLLFFGGIFLSLLLSLGSNAAGQFFHNPQLPELLRVFAVIPSALLPILAIEGVCMSVSKPVTLAVFQISSKLLTLFAVVIPILLGYSLRTATIAWAGISVLISISAMIVMFRPFRCPSHTIGGPTLKDILSYSLPLLGASLLSVILVSADRVIVSRFFGPEAFAVYINGAMQLPIVPIIKNSVMAVLLPAFAKMSTGLCSQREIANIWSRATQKTAILLYPLATFAFFHAEDLMRLLYSEQYVPSKLFFRIYLLACFVQAVAYAPLLLATRALGWYLIGHVAACSVAWIGGICLAVKFASPVCPCLAFVGGMYAMAAVFMWAVSKKLDIRMARLLPIKQLIMILTISIASAAGGWVATLPIIRPTVGWACLRVSIGTMVTAALYISLSSLSGKDMRSLLLSIYKRSIETSK